MPLTVDNSRALLNEVVNVATQKTQRVRAVRAFYNKGEKIGSGSVLELPAPLAFELRSANKVEFVASDTKLTKNSDVPAAPDANPPEKTAGKEGKK